MSTITYGTNKEAKGLEKAIAALKSKKEEKENTPEFKIGLKVKIIGNKFGGHNIGTTGEITSFHGEIEDEGRQVKTWEIIDPITANHFFHTENDLLIIKDEENNAVNSGSAAIMTGPAPTISPRAKPKSLYQTNIEGLAIQIKSLRTARGWSQRDLAAACGYSQGTITRAENNMWISITCLIRIANALGLQIKIT